MYLVIFTYGFLGNEDDNTNQGGGGDNIYEQMYGSNFSDE